MDETSTTELDLCHDDGGFDCPEERRRESSSSSPSVVAARNFRCNRRVSMERKSRRRRPKTSYSPGNRDPPSFSYGSRRDDADGSSPNRRTNARPNRRRPNINVGTSAGLYAPLPEGNDAKPNLPKATSAECPANRSAGTTAGGTGQWSLASVRQQFDCYQGVCNRVEAERCLVDQRLDLVLYHRVPWQRSVGYDSRGRRVSFAQPDCHRGRALDGVVTEIQLWLCYSVAEGRRFRHFPIRKSPANGKFYVESGDERSSAVGFTSLAALLRHHHTYAYLTGDTDFFDIFVPSGSPRTVPKRRKPL